MGDHRQPCQSRAAHQARQKRVAGSVGQYVLASRGPEKILRLQFLMRGLIVLAAIIILVIAAAIQKLR